MTPERCLRCSAEMEWRHGTWQCPRCRLKLGCCEGEPQHCDAEAPRYLFALSTAYVRAGQKGDGVKWATEARDLALKFGDTALAAAIDRDLASIR